jgi:hypothetical protein
MGSETELSALKSCVCQVLQNGPVTFPAECSPLDWTKFFRGS